MKVVLSILKKISFGIIYACYFIIVIVDEIAFFLRMRIRSLLFKLKPSRHIGDE